MRVKVGSKNPAKLDAVREMLADYPHLKDAEIIACEVDSGITDQPLSLEDVVNGAVNRATAAYADCDYAFGLESGLIPVPHSKSGYLDIGACAIYDGNEVHLGLSPAFELPDPSVFRSVVEKGMNLSDAARAAGYTEDGYVGWGEGVVGIATKGRMNRKEQSRLSVLTALIHIDP